MSISSKNNLKCMINKTIYNEKSTNFSDRIHLLLLLIIIIINNKVLMTFINTYNFKFISVEGNNSKDSLSTSNSAHV